MDSFKALCLDGISTFLYKNYWDIFGGSLRDVVQNFFKIGHLNSVLNMTFITLIEKVSNTALIH